MEGLSERAYAAHSGLSRGAIQKARKAGRLVVYGDGSINAAASDARRAEMTDPDQQRRSTGGDDRIQRPGRQRVLPQGPHRTDGLSGAGTPARDPEEKGHAGGSRPGAKRWCFAWHAQERDAWVTWPSRVAALMAADLTAEVEKQSGETVTIEAAILQRVLETHVRAQLDALADLRVSLGQ